MHLRGLAILVALLGAFTWWLVGRFDDAEGLVAPVRAETEPDPDPESRPHPSLARPSTAHESRAADETRLVQESVPERAFDLEVRVRLAGAPLVGVEVVAIGPAWAQERTDGGGRASFDLKPGSYEVMVPGDGAPGDSVTIYAPQGCSSAEVEVTRGKLSTVELAVYRGASLMVRFIDGEGEAHARGGRLYRWDGGWIDSRRREARDGLGVWSWSALEPGRYGLAPAGLWFDPIVVELSQGEQRTLEVTGHSVRTFRLEILSRSEPGGPVLPVCVRGTFWRRPDSSTSMPVPAGQQTFGYESDRDGRMEVRLFPGRYVVTLGIAARGIGSPGPLVQLVHGRDDAEAGIFELVVPPSGDDPTPSSVELPLELLGPLAEVHGHVVWVPDSNLALRFTGEDGQTHELEIWPDRGRFELLLDLGRIAGGFVELVQTTASREHVLASRRLHGGEQEWSVTMVR